MPPTKGNNRRWRRDTRQKAVLCLLACALGAFLSTLVHVLSVAEARADAITTTRLPKLREALAKTEIQVWVLMTAGSGPYMRDGPIFENAVDGQLRKLHEAKKKLWRGVRRYLVPDLNFAGPTRRALRKYEQAVTKLVARRQEIRLDPSRAPADTWRKTDLKVNDEAYDKAYKRAARKLQSLRRTCARVVLAALAVATASFLVAASCLLSLLAAVVPALCAVLLRKMGSRPAGLVPAYIYQGRLFVDSRDFSSAEDDVEQRRDLLVDDGDDDLDDLDDDDLDDEAPSPSRRRGLRMTDLVRHRRKQQQQQQQPHHQRTAAAAADSSEEKTPAGLG